MTDDRKGMVTKRRFGKFKKFHSLSHYNKNNSKKIVKSFSFSNLMLDRSQEINKTNFKISLLIFFP